MKHIAGRRYGCPCNEWVDACATCAYCMSTLRETDIREIIRADAEKTRQKAVDAVARDMMHALQEQSE